jgi:hypothetical protein
MHQIYACIFGIWSYIERATQPPQHESTVLNDFFTLGLSLFDLLRRSTTLPAPKLHMEILPLIILRCKITAGVEKHSRLLFPKMYITVYLLHVKRYLPGHLKQDEKLIHVV